MTRSRSWRIANVSGGSWSSRSGLLLVLQDEVETAYGDREPAVAPGRGVATSLAGCAGPLGIPLATGDAVRSSTLAAQLV